MKLTDFFLAELEREAATSRWPYSVCRKAIMTGNRIDNRWR